MRCQSAFAFHSKHNAELFVQWIFENNSYNYGNPEVIGDIRGVGPTEWLVQYSSETNFVRGVAIGIDLNLV